MKLLSALLILSSTSAFAALPPGEYTGRCDGTGTMQNFVNGKAVGAPFVHTYYQLIEMSVVADGAGTIEKHKTTIYGNQGPNGAVFEASTRQEEVAPGLVRVKNVEPAGSYSDYRKGADGSLTWISSTNKDGKVTKAQGISYRWVTPENVEHTVVLDNPATPFKVKKGYTGWAGVASTLLCVTQPKR